MGKPALTGREGDVMRLVLRGPSYGKLGIDSQGEAAAIAFEQELV